MIMEYVSGGELFEYILKHGKVTYKFFQCLKITVYVERIQILYYILPQYQGSIGICQNARLFNYL
jgi:hypothetical protein